jgi:hypothetical protein
VSSSSWDSGCGGGCQAAAWTKVGNESRIGNQKADLTQIRFTAPEAVCVHCFSSCF